MASSDVDICNSALIHLGAELITALTDNSDQARACNQFYAKSRDAVLTQANWTFATTKQEFTKLSGTPLYGFGFKYILPTNPYCLKPLRMENPEQDTAWKVLGREVHTDRDGLKMEYIFRQEDVSQFTPLFELCFEYFLAHRMAYTLTGSRSIAQDFQALFIDALADAEGDDAQTGSADEFESDDLILTRR